MFIVIHVENKKYFFFIKKDTSLKYINRLDMYGVANFSNMSNDIVVTLKNLLLKLTSGIFSYVQHIFTFSFCVL